MIAQKTRGLHHITQESTYVYVSTKKNIPPASASRACFFVVDIDITRREGLVDYTASHGEERERVRGRLATPHHRAMQRLAELQRIQRTLSAMRSHGVTAELGCCAVEQGNDNHDAADAGATTDRHLAETLSCLAAAFGGGGDGGDGGDGGGKELARRLELIRRCAAGGAFTDEFCAEVARGSSSWRQHARAPPTSPPTVGCARTNDPSGAAREAGEHGTEGGARLGGQSSVQATTRDGSSSKPPAVGAVHG